MDSSTDHSDMTTAKPPRARVELEETRVPASPWLDLAYVVSPGARMSLVVRGADLPRGTKNAGAPPA